MMERAVFSWDGDNAPGFDGWHKPEERWNGFACPYFDLDTVRAIAFAAAELADDEPDAYDVVEIRDDGTVWVTSTSDVEPYEVPTTEHGGQTLYGVGAWCWTWDDLRTLMPDPTEPDA